MWNGIPLIFLAPFVLFFGFIFFLASRKKQPFRHDESSSISDLFSGDATVYAAAAVHVNSSAFRSSHAHPIQNTMFVPAATFTVTNMLDHVRGRCSYNTDGMWWESAAPNLATSFFISWENINSLSPAAIQNSEIEGTLTVLLNDGTECRFTVNRPESHVKKADQKRN